MTKEELREWLLIDKIPESGQDDISNSTVFLDLFIIDDIYYCPVNLNKKIFLFNFALNKY